jgi:hypothetical protein
MRGKKVLILGIFLLLTVTLLTTVSAIRVGSCVDTDEGICTDNTVETDCVRYGGLFYPEPTSDLSQCQVGCCFYGGNSDVTTRVRCNSLAEEVGVTSNFDSNIQDFDTCYAQTAGNEIGACVYDSIGVTQCKRMTHSECLSLKGSSENVNFNEGYLCTSELLGNLCGKSTQTSCEEDGRIYYKDTCGNLGNIYDYRRYNDALYWDKIIDVEDSCGYEESNANSITCGNCDYLEGSYCGKALKGEDRNPNQGDYICKDLSCEYKGERYEHGESWCSTAEVGYHEINEVTEVLTKSKIRTLFGLLRGKIREGKTTEEEGVWTDFRPGTESYVMQCYYGEVLTQDCSTGESRNKICKETESEEGVSYGSCQANLWFDCIDQATESDCLNADLRDCEWIEGFTLLNKQYEQDSSLRMQDELGNEINASCVPKYSPAFKFWEDQGGEDAENICSLASDSCIVKYEFGILRNRENFDESIVDDPKSRKEFCAENCQCLEGYEYKDTNVPSRRRFEEDHINSEPWLVNNKDWKFLHDNVCFSLGDCGYSVNAWAVPGLNTEEDSIPSEFFKKRKDFEKEGEEGSE